MLLTTHFQLHQAADWTCPVYTDIFKRLAFGTRMGVQEVVEVIRIDAVKERTSRYCTVDLSDAVGLVVHDSGGGVKAGF